MAWSENVCLKFGTQRLMEIEQVQFRTAYVQPMRPRRELPFHLALLPGVIRSSVDRKNIEIHTEFIDD